MNSPVVAGLSDNCSISDFSSAPRKLARSPQMSFKSEGFVQYTLTYQLLEHQRVYGVEEAEFDKFMPAPPPSTHLLYNSSNRNTMPMCQNFGGFSI